MNKQYKLILCEGDQNILCSCLPLSPTDKYANVSYEFILNTWNKDARGLGVSKNEVGKQMKENTYMTRNFNPERFAFYENLILTQAATRL